MSFLLAVLWVVLSLLGRSHMQHCLCFTQKICNGRAKKLHAYKQNRNSHVLVLHLFALAMM